LLLFHELSLLERLQRAMRYEINFDMDQQDMTNADGRPSPQRPSPQLCRAVETSYQKGRLRLPNRAEVSI
jgi:hypothetical protein